MNYWDIGGPQMICRVLNLHYGKNELVPIKPFSKDGVRLAGNIKIMNNIELIMSDDHKTVWFERGNPTYLMKKLKSILTGKDYAVKWIFGKVYS
jgi:hypothetical protein